MITTILATVSILFSSIFGLAPMTESVPATAETVSTVGATICPDTLCYSGDIEPDAWHALEESGFLDNITEETTVTFVGYIDALTYDETLDFPSVHVTDAEGTTFVFSYYPSGIITA